MKILATITLSLLSLITSCLAESGIRFSPTTSTRVSDSEKMKSPSGKVLYVQNITLLLQDDLKSAHIAEYQTGQKGVSVYIQPEKIENFVKSIAPYKKQELALIVDDKILATTIISDNMKNGHFMLSGRLSEKETEEIVAILRKK